MVRAHNMLVTAAGELSDEEEDANDNEPRYTLPNNPVQQCQEIRLAPADMWRNTLTGASRA